MVSQVTERVGHLLNSLKGTTAYLPLRPRFIKCPWTGRRSTSKIKGKIGVTIPKG
jgi:hypothetical protein